MPSLSIPEAKKIIFSQEDISLPIKRSAWRLFIHELGKRDPKKKRAVSPKKALEAILAWMQVKKDQEKRAVFKINSMQKRILYLIIVEGFTRGQAAIHLDRSPETIKQYCINLRKQLGVDSFYQVVAIAIDRGWVPPPSALENNSH